MKRSKSLTKSLRSAKTLAAGVLPINGAFLSDSKQAIVIGAGIGGLATACLLGKNGWQVTVVEKNAQVGGRTGQLKAKGFTFDTGPSWYLMPEVFERFFGLLDENIRDYLKLVKLSPSYRIFYENAQPLDITSQLKKDGMSFEAIEAGAGSRLHDYLQTAEYMYQAATEQFLYKNYRSRKDFYTPSMLLEAKKLNVLSNLSSQVEKYFKSPTLRKILEFPAMFLGTHPAKLPAFYGLLNYSLLNQSVYYPMGGMYEITRALEKIARKQGVKIVLSSPVQKILVTNKNAIGVVASGRTYEANVVISNADVYHTETKLLEPSQRDHTEKYWQTRTMAPSALLMYVGVKRTYPSLRHHNVFFSSSWEQNLTEIFDGHSFPSNPSFYVCIPSKTDPSVAPAGHTNLFVLVPIAAGLSYAPSQLDRFADNILGTMETEMNLPDLGQNIVYKHIFGGKDFADYFNSFKGSGLGVAHNLRQSAIFRPSNTSKKVKGLYYVGANVHPGIGIPPALISAELVYKQITLD